MSKKDKKQDTKKKDAGKIFLEEVSKSPLTVTILAIFSGLLLGGLLVAVTTVEVYQAFDISFWEGIKTVPRAAWSTYEALFFGSVGNPGKIIAAIRGGEAEDIRRAFNPFFESLVVSTPYIFAGLAVALGFRVGLFNIGAEGQLYIGAATTVTAAIYLKGLPAIIHVPVSLLAGFMGGGLWGFIPGLLKATTGGHEVINTIMMNYIAFRLSEFLLRGPLKNPEGFTPVSAPIEESAKLLRFFESPIRFHIGFFIALFVAFLVYLFLFKTTWGYTLRTVGCQSQGCKICRHEYRTEYSAGNVPLRWVSWIGRSK